MATDVVGRLVEVISDISLAEFFEEEIFQPRGHLVVAQRVDSPQRVNSHLEQRILDVDVADPGDPLLIEQERLDCPPPPQQERSELPDLLWVVRSGR